MVLAPHNKRPRLRRRPIQRRGRATVDAILEAASQILARNGPTATSTSAVAERAGVSIGTLYQYFSDRDTLLHELVLRHLDATLAELSRAMTGLSQLPLADAVDRLVAAIVASHRAVPRLDQALHQSLPDRRLATIERFESRLEAAVARALAERQDLRLADPGLVASALVRGLGGLLRTTLRREPERIDDPALITTMRAMMLGTLLQCQRDD